MTCDAARDAYYAYGVDLIRSAGLLLRTTPSVIYRASILFQRFEASVDTHFRSQYIRAKDMPAYRQFLEKNLARAERLALQPASPPGSPYMTEVTGDGEGEIDASSLANGAEYLIPNHAQQEMRTGLVPLVDLRAPLDYCLHHLIDQEDIVYLAAACLLIATKMEDPAVRIRSVVNTCMRLSERRAGVVVNELQKPPPARYEDFKACVVDAEEVVLHQLGFQSFIETPYKYVLLYLNILVVPVGPSEQEAAAVGKSSTDAINPIPSPSSSSPSSRILPSRPQSAALTQWMVNAVQLVNDFPRCRQLLCVASDVLALYAIQHTCPQGLTLPSDWMNVFGVTAAAVTDVARMYAAYLQDGIGSRRATTALTEIRAQNAVAPYRTVKESDEYNNTLKGLKELRRTAAGGHSRSSYNAFLTHCPTGAHSPMDGGTDLTGPAFPPAAASIEELRDLISVPFAPPLSIGGSRRERAEPQCHGIAPKRSRGEPH
jgi:hypothetical protein